MKILLINNNFKPLGGVETVFFNTIELLENKGHTVIPFSVSDNRNVKTAYEKYFIRSNKLIHNYFYSFESRLKLRELIKNENPDIAHIHTFIGGVTPSILHELKRNKIPIVVTIHGFKLLCPAHVFINGKGKICEECKGSKYYKCILNNCSPRGLFHSFLIASESYLRDFLMPYYKLIDHFIFVSQFVRNKFIEINPIISEISDYIYNPTIVFTKSNISESYYLYFGRLSREKGLITLTSAFRDLKNLKLLIIGEGELKSKVESFCFPNIKVLGYKPGEELRNIVSKSYFVIVPSESYETLSMSTVESFAMGKPVIGTNIGALQELIEDNSRGYLFEPGNYRQLSEILLRSSKISKEMYDEFSYNAYNFAKENFSPEKHYSQLIKVYEKVIKLKTN